MADFGDFLIGATGAYMGERKEQRESEEWERRQRILADLDVDKQKRLYALQKKDGDTYQDETGQWVTEELDGAGQQVGVRPATAPEIAEAETTVIGRDSAKKGLQYMDEDQQFQRNSDRRADRQLGIQEAQLAQSRERFNWERRQAEAGASAGSNPHYIVESWLAGDEGKLAVKAYQESMSGMAANPNIRGGSIESFRASEGAGAEASTEYAARMQLKQQIMSTINALPPEERPKTKDEFNAFLSGAVMRSQAALERYRAK